MATRLAGLVAALALAAAGCGSDGGGGGAAADGVTDAAGDAAGGDLGPDAGDAADGAGGDATAAPDDTAPDDSAGDGGPDAADAAPDDGASGDAGADAAEDTGGAAVVPGTPCEPGARIGHFEVAHNGFYAAVTGSVAEGVIPLTVLQPVEEIGDCRLMQKVNPFCDPPCGAGQLCDHGGTCIPYPANRSVGQVVVHGLLKDPVEMAPNPTKFYSDVDVPFPLFEPGAHVTLAASGDELGPLALDAWGVPDLAVDEAPVVMESGKPLTLTWTAAPGAWRIWLSLNIDQHGNSPVTLFCDVEDTGSATLDAALVDKLLGFGVSGFATADVYRRTVDSAALAAGCVQLSVYSYASAKVSVAGHTPCFNDLQCPQGEVCDVPTNSCVDAP